MVGLEELLSVVDEPIENAGKVDLAVDLVAERQQQRSATTLLLELGDARLALAQRALTHVVRGRLIGRIGQETPQLGRRVAPVAARIDAQAGQATLIGPGANRVGVHA